MPNLQSIKKFNPFHRIFYWLSFCIFFSCSQNVSKGDDVETSDVVEEQNAQTTIKEIQTLIQICKSRITIFKILFYSSRAILTAINYILAAVNTFEQRIIVACIGFIIICFSEGMGWSKYEEKLSAIINELLELHNILGVNQTLTPNEKIRYFRLCQNLNSYELYSDKMAKNVKSITPIPNSLNV